MSKPPLWTPKGVSDWLAHASTWQQAAVASGAVLAAGLSLWWSARLVKRRTMAAAERLRSAMAGDETNEPMDPYIAFVTLMATLLSVSGMWRVFGETMHLPNLVRGISCSVLEASGFAFMRLARKDIQMKRPATQHTVIVWVIATLSGALSAGASKSFLEVVIRFCMPLLAVKLCHSWMLPIPAEITLNQLQKGKRAWRYIKAQRRVERANTGVTKYVAGKLLDLESDRLAKRALMIGDASSVLAASERASIGEALRALGVRPTEQDQESGVRESVTAGVRESVGPQAGPDSVGAGVRESESEQVRESVAAAGLGSVSPDSDSFEGGSGLGSASPRVRESASPQGPDPVGPWGGGSGSGLGDGADWAAWENAAAGPGRGGSVAAGLIPAMRHTADESALVAAQAVNGHAVNEHQAAAATTLSWQPATGSATTGLPESEGPGVRESEGPGLAETEGPGVREPESAPGSVGPTGPDSAGPDPSLGESESESGLGSVGPRVRESVGPQGPDSAGPWSRPVESDPRWSDETGLLAREIVARHWLLDSGRPTRRAFLETLRERGGKVASEHRSALYAFALAPHVPTEDELGDDTTDFPEGIPGLAERLAGETETESEA